jgi:hypothetical protein
VIAQPGGTWCHPRAPAGVQRCGGARDHR